MEVLTLALAIGATCLLVATTRYGQSILKRTRLRDRIPGAAKREDLEFLLGLCDGDRLEVDRRLDFERERLPDLPEADHCRRAIRKALSERDC